jgi:hypothetical protein
VVNNAYGGQKRNPDVVSFIFIRSATDINRTRDVDGYMVNGLQSFPYIG